MVDQRHGIRAHLVQHTSWRHLPPKESNVSRSKSPATAVSLDQ